MGGPLHDARETFWETLNPLSILLEFYRIWRVMTVDDTSIFGSLHWDIGTGKYYRKWMVAFPIWTDRKPVPACSGPRDYANLFPTF